MGQQRLDIIAPSLDFNSPMKSAAFKQSSVKQRLVAWIMEKANYWEEYREANFKTRWDEYYRLWRGVWHSDDKTRDSERSRLITPALQQAIEASVAELEEATFGKGKWFDIEDDYQDQENQDVEQLRNLLLESMEEANVPSDISEIYLNAALYGTGIGKIIVEKANKKSPLINDMGLGLGKTFESSENELIVVKIEAIPPENFVIDPSARNIDEALGCGHMMIKPKHTIIAKQQEGIYFDFPLGDFTDDIDVSAKGESKPNINTDKVKIFEYAGLVPKKLLEFI